jgi:hypothetical protein
VDFSDVYALSIPSKKISKIELRAGIRGPTRPA